MDAHNIRISKMKLNVKRVGRRALKLTAWHRHSVLGTQCITQWFYVYVKIPSIYRHDEPHWICTDREWEREREREKKEMINFTSDGFFSSVALFKMNTFNLDTTTIGNVWKNLLQLNSVEELLPNLVSSATINQIALIFFPAAKNVNLRCTWNWYTVIPRDVCQLMWNIIGFPVEPYVSIVFIFFCLDFSLSALSFGFRCPFTPVDILYVKATGNVYTIRH